MAFLAGVFACDLPGFSILSNHFHLVVRNRPDLVSGWDDVEVARRWYRLCPVRVDAAGQPMEPTEAELGMIVNNPDRLAELRRRLSSCRSPNRKPPNPRMDSIRSLRKLENPPAVRVRRG